MHRKDKKENHHRKKPGDANYNTCYRTASIFSEKKTCSQCHNYNWYE
jgi:hypothetical protein